MQVVGVGGEAKDTFESKKFIFFSIELNTIRFGGHIRI